MFQNHWVGIDCGYSHLCVAVLDDAGNVLAVEDAHHPQGNGHDRDVALARLQHILTRLSDFRNHPVHLAGYCYDDSGVESAFSSSGWSVVGSTALNDVVGIYGLTRMRAHALVAGCGSHSQLVYIDSNNNVCWPSDRLAQQLPDWLLCGSAYAQFMHEGGDRSWTEYGALFATLTNLPNTRAYLQRAADVARETRDAFWQACGSQEPPALVMGGGAIKDDRVWERLEVELNARGITANRVLGVHAAGLVRYALAHPLANAWSFVGDQPPGWLA